MDAHPIPIDDLSADLLARWREMHHRLDERAGPFLHPSWARAVSLVRRGIEVGVLLEDGRVVGFLPYERLPLDVGGPLGGRLCDLAGALLERGIECDPADVARRLGLRMLRLPRASVRDPLLGQHTNGSKRSPYIDLSEGFDGYQRASRDAGSKLTKQVGQRSRKLEREHERVEFAWHTSDDSVLEALLEWKAVQRRETRSANVLELPWARALIDILRTRAFDGIAPVLSSLWVDGTPAAAHFGIKTDRVLHYWIAGYNDDFSRYSPGLITLMRVAEAAPARGVERIDLGPGEERYKVRAASGFLDVGRATVTTGVALETVMRVVDGVRSWSGNSPLGEQVRASGRALTRAVYALQSAVGGVDVRDGEEDRPRDATEGVIGTGSARV